MCSYITKIFIHLADLGLKYFFKVNSLFPPAESIIEILKWPRWNNNKNDLIAVMPMKILQLNEKIISNFPSFFNEI